MIKRAAWWLLIGSVVELAACAPVGPSVVRVVDGRELPGRFVNHYAYAAYARGALLEASGDLRGAARAYGEALREDGASVEIWTRLGTLRCQLGSPTAFDAFEQARDIDEEFEPLWRAQALCHERRGELERALTAAQRALTLDATIEQTSALIASLYDRLKRPRHARRYLDALLAQNPQSIMGYEALLTHAMRNEDAAAKERAAQALAQLQPWRRQELATTVPNVDRERALSRALSQNDLPNARRLALELRLPPGEFAVRAAEVGRPELALEHARRVLAADPDDGDAWVAALVAADLLGDGQAFRASLQALRDSPVAPGPVGARLLSSLLARRVSEQASTAWQVGYGGFGARAEGAGTDAEGAPEAER